MPTTRSAKDALTKVQAAALVRFDSSMNEFVEPSPTASVASAFPPSPIVPRATRGRAKRKSEEGAHGASTLKSKSKRPRKGQEAAAREASPGKSILKPISFETNTQGLTLSPPTVPAPPSPSDAQPATPLDGPPLAAPAPVAAADFVPAELSFDLDEAKAHLINADRRFEEIFKRLRCKPFEDLARVDPFRTLTQSILGQQISWLAARSITYKFVRLFNPQLPEQRPENAETLTGPLFPTAEQVAATPLATLRTAGLSERKASYVRDLAARFADGRLGTAQILAADDGALAALLTAVRGVGRWTVDMFAIFSLRRPDILPVGDLGVQKGLARWALARRAPQHAFAIHPQKVEQPADVDEGDGAPAARTRSRAATPVPADAGASVLAQPPPRGSSPDASSVPPAVAPAPSTPGALRRSSRRSPAKPADAGPATPQKRDGGLPALPTPFTASIDRVLAGAEEEDGEGELPQLVDPRYDELPAGLTVAALKARLDGKKKIKGMVLTPQEMEALTASWRPYRSIGVYYMWALADQDKKK